MQPFKSPASTSSERSLSGSLTEILHGMVSSLRPHQWIKNLLLFSGLIFSGSLMRRESLIGSLQAFAVFCLASSGIYLFNDLRDLASDREHPVKRLRPLAAGIVPPSVAVVMMLALLIGAMIGALQLNLAFTLILCVYLLLNVGYSFGLKHVVILDVVIVAMGFVLRAVAGAVVINVEPSHWLIICTLMLALMVVIGKRRYDLVLEENGFQIRNSDREWYSIQFLDLMMAIAAGAAIVTYALYTLAPETVARFGSRGMVMTIPFVLYGIFRYLFLMHRQSGNGDPAMLFLTDRPTLLNVLLWAIVVLLVLYGSRLWQFAAMIG